MIYFILWYITVALFGLAALPLVWTWLRFLPDRGWGVLRPLGLLLSGVAVWLAGTFDLLRVSAASGIGALVLLLFAGVWSLKRWGGGWDSLRMWLREHRTVVLAEELLFFALFLFWVWYRIHETMGIAHTEQPMDFALMNAILRRGEIPPNDPWLSGFAISYYYLGYLIMAQLAAFSTVPSGVAYNLGLMTLAAMAGTGVFSIAFNLLSAELRHRRVALTVSLLAPLLLVGISNLTGVLTMTYHRGLFSDTVYRWFNVVGLVPDAATGMRRAQEGWWWWNASRTLSYLDANGNPIDVIDEFPFFSFLLGDMHPHVLALPFALAAVAVALNGLRGGLVAPFLRHWQGINLPPESWSVDPAFPGFGRLALGLTVIIVGAFAMLNTWDLPTIATLVTGVWLVAAVTSQQREEESARQGLFGWLRSVMLLAGGALLLYLPFYAGFSSQARGIRVSPFSTPPQQYLLMFGLFWLVLVPLALSQMRHISVALRGVSARVAVISGAMLVVDAAALFFILRAPLDDGLLALLMAAAWVVIPLALSSLAEGEDPVPLVIAQAAGFPLLAGLVFQRWTVALVATLLGLTLLALWARVRERVPRMEPASAMEPVSRRPAVAGGSEAATPGEVALSGTVEPASASLIFALGIAAVALLLTMGSEIFYILDGFQGRMNTVFKLYYQAWSLMGLATIFALVYVSRRAPRVLTVPWLLLFSLLVILSLWYPVEALQSKADLDGPAQWDGRFWMANVDPDRLAAIEWLDALPGQVVVLERLGDQYNATHSALSGWTGHSTLVGWGGHELQWRGTYEEVGRREPVIAEIYQSADAERTRQLLEEWGIDYVALTPQEIAHYNLSGRQIEKFYEIMTPVFQQGSVTLFGR